MGPLFLIDENPTVETLGSGYTGTQAGPRLPQVGPVCLSKFTARRAARGRHTVAKYAADFPFRINKVTISGTCFGGLEQWSTGFYLGAEDADAADPGVGTAAAIAPLWQTYFTGVKSKTSTKYATTQIKVSQLETDGDVDLDMINIYDYPAAIFGTNPGGSLPPQISLAATLTSQYQRGLASKGRMYLPGVNTGVGDTTAKIGDAERNDIKDGLKTFFDAVNASGSIDGYVILASKGHKVMEAPPSELWHYLEGRLARVTNVKVGNVYDTQRRRRNELVETYSVGVLA